MGGHEKSFVFRVTAVCLPSVYDLAQNSEVFSRREVAMKLHFRLLLSFISCSHPARAFMSSLEIGRLRGGPVQVRFACKQEPQRSCSMQYLFTPSRGSHHPSRSILSMSSPEAAASSTPVEPASTTPLVSASETVVRPGVKISDEWELDVYSRPVLNPEGKKLWELLVCDSTGNFRHVSPIASNMVNSREVRKIIQGVIEEAPESARPKVIRFFRNAMFNMIDIALREVEVTVRPCRTTYAMYQWLEEREREVYPKMQGFKANMKQGSVLDIRVSAYYLQPNDCVFDYMIVRIL